jgi:hypothetical protein
LLNGAFFNEQAGHLAARVRREGGADVSSQVRLAFQLTFCRPPRDSEMTRVVDFLKHQQESVGARPERAMAAFCLVLLNSNEFAYPG